MWSISWFIEVLANMGINYRYRSYIEACFAGNPVDEDIPEGIIDHRFFYDIDGVGQYVCGAVRNAITKKLVALGKEAFTTQEVLHGMDRFVDNPSVTGYFVERAVLRSIATVGLATTPPRKQLLLKLRFVRLLHNVVLFSNNNPIIPSSRDFFRSQPLVCAGLLLRLASWN